MLLLSPRGVDPEDLELTVQVQEIYPQGWHQQHVEVLVTWRWLRLPRREPFGHPNDHLVIGFDPGRWMPTEPRQWYGADHTRHYLSRLGQPYGGRMLHVTPGQDGEFSMVVMGHELGEHYRAEILPIQVHYVRALTWWHATPERGWLPFVPAGREWVKSIDGPFPLP